MAPEERVEIEALMAEIRPRAEEELLEGSSDQSRRQRLRFVLENGHLQLERTLAPGRGVVERLRAAARRFVFRETRQTTEPVLEKQSAWNRAVGALLQEQAAEIERLRRVILDMQVDDNPVPPGEGEEGEAAE